MDVKSEFTEDTLVRANLLSETLGGVTNAASALSNGRLSIGISPWAELIYLRWPYLSYHDHFRYFTLYKLRNLLDLLALARGLEGAKPEEVRWGANAPSPDWRLYGRPLEPYPELGSRAGFLPQGASCPTWLGDPTWTSKRRYAGEDSGPLR